MQTIVVHAGLANKIFQYAFYKALSLDGHNVAIDQNLFKPVWQFEDISLSDAFCNLHYEEETSLNIAKLAIYRKDVIGKMLRRILPYRFNNKLILERSFAYEEGVEKRFSKDCVIYGLWQSEKYFIRHKAQILDELRFKPLRDEKNLAFKHEVAKTNAVSIHIRKGKDYTHLDKICTLEYYKEAVSYIQQKIQLPVFYVFTDNKEWVEENFRHLDITYKICDWNPVSGKESFRDMQLMSLCKHHIIANSSFSWWGAYLDANPSKIVVAPKVWFGRDSGFFSNESDIIPSDWIKL